MNRRILLIDADPAFRASLAQRLERYRFEIAVEPEPEHALALAAAALPALLMVSVEEPDKAGFKVFQRCKKGALAKVPIVLLTSTVSPESFAKHRGLKVHADEYIDKRSVSDDELLGKIDNLIGLGELVEDNELGMSLEVEEIPLSSDDMVLEETVGEDDGGAGDAEQRVDSMVEAETDAAFAALLGDDAMFAPAEPSFPSEEPVAPEVLEPDELAPETLAPGTLAPGMLASEMLEPDELAPDELAPETLAPEMLAPDELAPDELAPDELAPETLAPEELEPEELEVPEVSELAMPLLPRTDTMRTNDDDADDAFGGGPGAGVPAMIYDGGRPQDSGGVEFDSFSRESMRPPVDLIARARQDYLDQAAGVVAASAMGPQESVPSIAIDVEDLEPVEDPASAVPESLPPQATFIAPEPSRPKFLDVSTVVEARPHVAAAAVQAPASSHNSAPVPDLGLDDIAMPEAMSEQSGVYDRRALRKIGELERQVSQLKTELDRARATADASARGANREREFLSLREQLIAKEKDLHRVRDDLRARDRDLAEAQDRLHDAEQARTALEARAAEFAQQAAAETNRAAALEARSKAHGGQFAALQQELEARSHAATTAEAARAQLEHDLAEERALRATSASEAELSLRSEREQLVARHQAELTAHHDEAVAAREAALRALREQLEGDHATAVEGAVAATRTEVATQADHAVSQLEARHGAELARLKDQHDAALAQLTGERDDAMARIASERDAAVAATEDEHGQAIAQLQAEHAAERAQLRDAAAAQLAQGRDELTRTHDELTRTRDELTRTRDELTRTRDELTRTRDELTRELAQMKQEAEARAAEALAVHEHAETELHGELDRVRQQLAAVRVEQEASLGAAAEGQTAALGKQASLHAAELARHQQDHAAELARYEQHYAAELAKHQQAHAAELAKHQQDHAAELTQRQQDHAAELTQRQQDHAAELARYEQDRAAELARHEQEHTATRTQDAATHQEALAALRSELERQAAIHGDKLGTTRKELDDLVEQHEHAKGTLIEQHRLAVDEIEQRHAAERAQASEDKQRVIEGLQHAVASERAASERAAAQHRAEFEAHTESAEREAAEHRTALAGAKRALDEAVANHQAERAAAEREIAQRLEDQKAQHERALGLVNGELVKTKALSDAEHGKAIAAVNAEHERQRKELLAQHAQLVGELTTERDELRRGLSSARDSAKRNENELGSAVQTIADRNAELRAHAAAIAERDQRIADLRRDLEGLEQENANYQEQVLRAYQKIKTDEAMVARAKKAMAIALTVLDDQGNPKAEPT